MEDIFGKYREDNSSEREKDEKKWNKQRRKEYVKEKYEKTKQVLKRTTKRRKLKTVPHRHAFGGMLYRHW